ncbi:MAG: hypothetical protein KJ587_11925 [Alphaproteobacteria bacterium]|nr:hypothetical protein [Alphaproteobacteria bacterium]
MNKFYAVAMSAILAITFAVQAPTQAQAGAKEKALVAGLVAGAAVAAVAYAASSKSSKLRSFSKSKVYANDDCGPGYFMKHGKCKLRGGDFKVSKFGGGKKLRSGGFNVSKVSKQRTFTNWQLQAIAKGCKPGLAWSKFEGCHEND